MSSGVHGALGRAAGEMVGTSAYSFIPQDQLARSYQTAYCGDPQTTSVCLMNLNAIHRDGTPRHTRLVVFGCDTCTLAVAMVFGRETRLADPTLAVRRAQQSSANGWPRVCMVLENVLDSQPIGEEVSTHPSGPRIVFVTSAIANIVDLEPDELAGTPFLKLVAAEGLSKAARFLEDMAQSEGVVFATLPFVNQSSPGGCRVKCELVGAHSDDGAVLLCRMVSTSGNSNSNSNSSTGTASDTFSLLSDLLSSDLETSDCPSPSLLPFNK